MGSESGLRSNQAVREAGESSRRHARGDAGLYMRSFSQCKFISLHFFLCLCFRLLLPLPLASFSSALCKTSISWKQRSREQQSSEPFECVNASLAPSSNFGKQHLPVPEGHFDLGSGMLHRCSPPPHCYSVPIATIDVLSYYMPVCYRVWKGGGI